METISLVGKRVLRARLFDVEMAVLDKSLVQKLTFQDDYGPVLFRLL